jgi:ergothioneine biosynthesis protein EgtB
MVRAEREGAAAATHDRVREQDRWVRARVLQTRGVDFNQNPNSAPPLRTPARSTGCRAPAQTEWVDLQFRRGVPRAGGVQRAPCYGSVVDLAESYREARAATEALCAPLSPEDCNLQSMPDASPVKWHLAHTTWFFETLALEGVPGYAPFHPAFRVLFNSYYESVGERHARPERGVLSRPSLEEVRSYRRQVDAWILRLLDAGAPASALDVIELGIHHEQQHQELVLTDLKHAFSRNPLRPAYRERATSASEARSRPKASGVHLAGPAEALRWLGFEGGLREIGHGSRGFAFDNERPRHRVFLEPFELASRPVTNAEYLEFVRAGGYERPELWLSDGFQVVCARGWRVPLYWEERDGAFFAFTLSGREPLRLDEPVCHVSHYEADAYARWARARLPTEAEWECAAEAAPIEGNLAESGRFHPAPSPAAGRHPSALFGDVWEWTASAYGPYPGFRPLAGPLGEYNGKFMSGQLVLRGGSCATPRTHIRSTYRNFFPPDARWQFSGIRLARDAR